MDTLLPAKDPLWEEERRGDQARKAVDRRSMLKKFALALALIVSTIAVATVLAALFQGAA